MSNEVQDVTVEEVVATETEATQDLTVETEADASGEVDETETTEEAEQVEVDYKAKSEKLEKKLAADQAKINRQRAALSQLQKEKQELASRQAEVQVEQQSSVPQADDYDTYEQFETARSDYYKEQGRLEGERVALENHQRALQDQSLKVEREQFAKAEQEFRTALPTYDESKVEVEQFLQVKPINGATGDAIYAQAARDGSLPAVINYFGENNGERLSELEHIATMTPVEAAVEVYKIQQKIKSAPTAPKAKPIPAPITKVRGTGTKSKGLDANSSGDDVLKTLGLK